MARCFASHALKPAPHLLQPHSRRRPPGPVPKGISCPAPRARELATPPRRPTPDLRNVGDTASVSKGRVQTARLRESPAGTPHSLFAFQQPGSASERRQSCAVRPSSPRGISKYCAVTGYRWRVAAGDGPAVGAARAVWPKQVLGDHNPMPRSRALRCACRNSSRYLCDDPTVSSCANP